MRIRPVVNGIEPGFIQKTLRFGLGSYSSYDDHIPRQPSPSLVEAQKREMQKHVEAVKAQRAALAQEVIAEPVMTLDNLPVSGGKMLELLDVLEQRQFWSPQNFLMTTMAYLFPGIALEGLGVYIANRKLRATGELPKYLAFGGARISDRELNVFFRYQHADPGKALARLEEAGLIAKHEFGLNLWPITPVEPDVKFYWRLTPEGRQALKAYKKAQKSASQAKAPAEKPGFIRSVLSGLAYPGMPPQESIEPAGVGESGLVLATSKQAPPPQAQKKVVGRLGIRQLRVLVATTPAGVPGWKVLDVFQQQERSRSRWKKMMNARVSEAQLAAALPNPEGIKATMKLLHQVGLMDSHDVTAKAPDWYLTCDGERSWKAGDPITSGRVTKKEQDELLQLEIEDLKTQQTENDRVVVEMEAALRSVEARLADEKDDLERRYLQKLAEGHARQLSLAQAANVEARERITAALESLQDTRAQLQLTAINQGILTKLGEWAELREGLSSRLESIQAGVALAYQRSANDVAVEQTGLAVKQRVQVQLGLLANAQAPNLPLAAVLQIGETPKTQSKSLSAE